MPKPKDPNLPTVLQTSVLHFIRNFREHNDGATPTYRNIAEELDHKSNTAIAVSIRELIRKGHLRKGPGRHLVPIGPLSK